MKILMFGKTGQVAREVLARAEDVIALGRDEADLSDPGACAAAIAKAAEEGAEIVINAAAYTAVDKAEEEEDLATAINGAAPEAMARAAASAGLPFLHISTDYVFDGAGEAPFAPDHPTAPLGAYGRSKLAGEEGVRAAGGQSVILRTSWVFSAQGGNFVKTMLRLSESRDRLTIVGDQIGGPTPAADIAEALLAIAAAFHEGRGVPGTYHFAGAPETSWAGFAREIFAQAGREVEVADIPSAEYPTPAARPLNSRLDGTTLEEAYGIRQPDWRTGLTDVLAALQKETP
ncbi:dTDP-4-dehydrorhamnose reductase [Pseudoroseicyclus tamaricis]|uniref:dTDP-4-dehydrorhamnose reductase n=1 Tax=Pseudoroseicyclus tamaricis TaxID=2705421 RepID=A0A6B2JV17_9RHOB|nr:dTDP-4-dehydrorhamnose reductase [Pseudoroseicyclus tamaricis]NDV02178.1 dTDP-4-dehydrorhamnose reductase [Pseudoroseicyclus tamaricis]